MSSKTLVRLKAAVTLEKHRSEPHKDEFTLGQVVGVISYPSAKGPITRIDHSRGPGRTVYYVNTARYGEYAAYESDLKLVVAAK